MGAEYTRPPADYQVRDSFFACLSGGRSGRNIVPTNAEIRPMPTSYGIDRIQQLLPHRYPFLLVDRVLEAAEDGRHLVAIKNVTANEPFFQGHFPGNPIMPGVLHVEAIAQACGLMCLSAAAENAGGDVKNYDTILASVENAKFRRMIVPGDQMRIETTLLQRSRNMGKGKGVVTVDGKVATEATLSFLLVPRKTEG